MAVGVIAEIAARTFLRTPRTMPVFLETNKKKILSWLMLTLAIVPKNNSIGKHLMSVA